MAINPHHTVEEIAGIRCSVIEKNISAERAEFITAILKSNNLVTVSEIKPDGSVVIGVTDITFNLTNTLYSRQLKNTDKTIVTPSYWYKQITTEGFYWEY